MTFSGSRSKIENEFIFMNKERSEMMRLAGKIDMIGDDKRFRIHSLFSFNEINFWKAEEIFRGSTQRTRTITVLIIERF